MLERGIPEQDVTRVCYRNALDAFGKSGKFSESDWLLPAAIDQRELFEGNSVLRGQAPNVALEAVASTGSEFIIK
jgi:hypothetical protein